MNNILQTYLTRTTETLQLVAEQNEAAFNAAGKLVANAYAAGKHIYVFGCTHSAILAEDVFFRAGAPAFWRPLWGPGMNISNTPGFLSSAVERNEELGNSIVACSQMGEGDVLVVLSTSAKNAAPVAVAAAALKRGVKLIIVASGNYRTQRGNHSRIANLWALAPQAVMIDNQVPCGDASIQVGDFGMGPVSTMAGSFIMHAISAIAVAELNAMNITAPVFKSSNAPGGREFNEKLLADPEIRNAFLLP